MYNKIKYTIEGSNNYYQIFNNKGRLLMYFKYTKGEYFNMANNHLESNIDLYELNDMLIDYCVTQIKFEFLKTIKLEFYLKKIISRIMIHKNANNFFIDSYFLNKEGKLQASLLNIYNKIKNDIEQDIDMYIHHNKAYTEITSSIIMDIVNTPHMFNRLVKKGLEIQKEEFENLIPNESIGLAYVEHYVSDAIFYKLWDHDDPIDSVYLMIKNNKIVLLYSIPFPP